MVCAPRKGAGRALSPPILWNPARVLRPAKAHWLDRPSPVVSPPANVRCPFGTDAVALRSYAFARMFTHVCTCGLPRKYQIMVGLSSCHTSQTPSPPTSRFL